jgi:KipI family sensor histidine kinase inhibitor
MKIRPYGEDALLVEIDDGQPIALVTGVAALRGAHAVVPAARTLLVRFDPTAVGAGELAEQLPSVQPSDVHGGGMVELEVRYDGPDLADVARRAGIREDDVIQRHCAPTYTVAFCGFSPGFAYLTGLDPLLQQPRLDEPRTSVPAGSVGVAGEFTGVYPTRSPGGWQLLGTTDAALWDIDRDQPALLPPGTSVRFVPR